MPIIRSSDVIILIIAVLFGIGSECFLEATWMSDLIIIFRGDRTRSCGNGGTSGHEQTKRSLAYFFQKLKMINQQIKAG